MDTLVLPVMDELRVCLDAMLADSHGGKTCATMLVPGQLVVADRCACKSSGGGRPKCTGQAWVRLDRTFPVRPFPTQDLTTDSCVSRMAAVLELGVLRCVPTLDSKGKPPEATELAEAVMVATDDARAMRCAAVECWPGRSRVLGFYAAKDSGDCGGGTQLVTVELGRVTPVRTKLR